MSKIAKMECEDCEGRGYNARTLPGHEECGCSEDVSCGWCNGKGYEEVILEDNGTWHKKDE